jgi:L,D-peptidoglycan transpeptidase YkuD (ErfK/YbiS/YcfS/YnhG family)
MADIELLAPDRVRVGEKEYHCATGKGGIRTDKREGDGATPVGVFPLREMYWRPDKFAAQPVTALPAIALNEAMGWCDAPEAPEYNQHVTLPFTPSHEKLWREDDVYDVVIVIGYNDAPVVAGAGSAIFMHLARPNYEGTEGCIAVTREDMLEILAQLTPQSRVIVPPTSRSNIPD